MHFYWVRSRPPEGGGVVPNPANTEPCAQSSSFCSPRSFSYLSLAAQRSANAQRRGTARAKRIASRARECLYLNAPRAAATERPNRIHPGRRPAA